LALQVEQRFPHAAFFIPSSLISRAASTGSILDAR
jgi:hypothetical protein